MEDFEALYTPPVLLSGPRSIRQIGPHATAVGGERALLVADTTLAKIVLAGKVTNLLNAAELEIALFSEVEPEP